MIMKKQIMSNFYNGMIRLFQKWEYEKLVVKCECNSKLKHGFSNCETCGGSGYRNAEDVNQENK
jgi:hypothetical protein